ncbi:MAG: response regulator [Methanoregula sp.]|jgi:DNA-binding NtrC family response regulator|nr:response regulator [Methanoregula sp.]
MSGKGKVLLMDDEQVILDVTGEILTFLKYDVMSAKDGQAAVDLYKKEKDAGSPFDVVILDLSVPHGMGGKETISLLRSVDPDVKAVVSSGYTNDPVVHDFSRYGFCEKLTKPYNINAMKDLLENIIKK